MAKERVDVNVDAIYVDNKLMRKLPDDERVANEIASSDR